MSKENFKSWKASNGEDLRKQFSKQFGMQVQEWDDFLESEYRKYLRSGPRHERK